MSFAQRYLSNFLHLKVAIQSGKYHELEEIHQTVAEEQTEKDNVRLDEEKFEVNQNNNTDIFCNFTSRTRRRI